MNDLVVSSRVRLARNIENVPFKTKNRDAFDAIAATILQSNPRFTSWRVSALSQTQAGALFEQHLISRELLENKANSMLVTSPDNKVVVMLGEEDHIRIQSIQVGFDLKTAFDSAMKISKDIAAAHKIAHRADFGYLTSCPTNLGTGMRASVMMFLPALTLNKKIMAIAKRLSNRHITVRGVYGEGSDTSGFMYQISNQACLGLGESEILQMVTNVVAEIAHFEIEEQRLILSKDHDDVIDTVNRAWGLLTNAHLISSAEAVYNIGLLKLGACLNVIRFKNGRLLDDLFFLIQPQTLVVKENTSSVLERDKLRAKRIKERLCATRL